MASASPPQEESLDDFVASESQHSDEVIEVEGPASFENITVVGSQVYALRDFEIRELIIKTEQTELPDEVKLKFMESSFPNTYYCLDSDGKIEIRASEKIKKGTKITRHPNLADEIGQKIQKFMAITAVKNESVAKSFLTKQFWDCDATIDTFFENRQDDHVGAVTDYGAVYLGENQFIIKERKEKIQKFMEKTKNAEEVIAEFYLAKENWEFDQAIMMYNLEKFENPCIIKERKEKIQKFMEKTKNAEEVIAEFYLAKENWELDQAIMMYNVETFVSDQKRKPPKFGKPIPRKAESMEKNKQ